LLPLFYLIFGKKLKRGIYLNPSYSEGYWKIGDSDGGDLRKKSTHLVGLKQIPIGEIFPFSFPPTGQIGHTPERERNSVLNF
jgi:hypothetical protein